MAISPYQMNHVLRLALVTDIHNGRDSLTKKGAAALGLLSDFSGFVTAEKPDLVVELGDRITDTDADTDWQSLRGVAKAFEAMPAPVVHVLGNHDLVHLSREQNEAALCANLRSSSIDVKGWHLVFWQLNVGLRLYDDLDIGEEDLAWLKADLESTSLPSIVFTHIPLDGASMTGNYYFEASPQLATYRNASAAREAISAAGNVAACIAGHVHWNSLSRIDGVPYITLQSLTESYTTHGEAAGGWAMIELDRQLRWQGFGGDPIALTVNLGGGNQRWAQPLPPLSSVRRKRVRKSRRLLGSVKALLIDLDGVVYRNDQPVDGAVETLERLMSSGIGVIAITNNARATALEYRDKLRRMGLLLNESQIITSADAMASFLATFDAPRVHFAAPPALRRRMLDVGVIESERPDFVIAGIDAALTLADLNQAVCHLTNGARLLVSNMDKSLPTATGQAAEAGAVAAFLEVASGRPAETFGKPEPAMFQMALERANCSASEAVVVGDNYDTDILGANRAGIRSVFVQSGNPPNEDSQAVPDLILSDISALEPLLSVG